VGLTLRLYARAQACASADKLLRATGIRVPAPAGASVDFRRKKSIMREILVCLEEYRAEINHTIGLRQ